MRTRIRLEPLGRLTPPDPSLASPPREAKALELLLRRAATKGLGLHDEYSSGSAPRRRKTHRSA